MNKVLNVINDEAPAHGSVPSEGAALDPPVRESNRNQPELLERFLAPVQPAEPTEVWPASPGRIVLLLTDRIGDCLNTLYLLHNLRTLHAEAEITFVGMPFMRDPLFGFFDQFVDRIVTLEELKDADERLEADLLIDLNPYTNAEAHRQIEAEIHIGLTGPDCDHVILRGAPPQPKALQFLQFIAASGRDYVLSYPQAELEAWLEERPKSIAIPTERFAVLCPEATSRLWSLSKGQWSDLVQALLDEGEIDKVVVVGNRINNTDFVGDELWEDDRVVDCVHAETTLLDVAHLMQRAEFVISVDTGLMHLASYMGSPLLALFPLGEPEYSGPQGLNGKTRVLWLRKAASCEYKVGYKRTWMHCEECRLSYEIRDIISAVAALRDSAPTTISERFAHPSDTTGFGRTRHREHLPVGRIYNEIMQSPLLEWRSRLASASVATLKISDGCNLQCRYCHVGAPLGKHNMLRLEDFYRTIALFIEFSKARAISFELHGGEPLLFPQELMERVIRFSHEYYWFASTAGRIPHNRMIQWRMVSNGTLMTRTTIDFMRRNNVTICLSIDGPPWIHDEMRGKGERTWETVKLLQDNGMEFGVISVMSDHNIDRMEEVIDYFAQHGVHRIQVNPMIKTKDGRGEDVDEPSVAQHAGAQRVLLERMLDSGGAFQEANMINRILRYAKTVPYRETLSVCNHRHCTGGTSMFVVSPEGDVFPCDRGQNHGDSRLGSVRTGPDEEGFGNVLDEFRASTPKDLECLRCPAKQTCIFGCVVMWRDDQVRQADCMVEKSIYARMEERSDEVVALGEILRDRRRPVVKPRGEA